jgi:AraC-like DNA-binding protein
VVNSERTAIIVRLEAMRDEILELAAAWRSWSRWACWCRKAASATVSSQRSPGRARWPNASRWKPLRLSSPQFMKRMSRLGASHPAQSRRLRRSRDKTHVGRKLKHCQPLIARPKYARRFSHPLELLLDISLDPRAAMSPYRFLRTFRMVVGLTPHQFDVHTRLSEAAARLRLSRDSSQHCVRRRPQRFVDNQGLLSARNWNEFQRVSLPLKRRPQIASHNEQIGSPSKTGFLYSAASSVISLGPVYKCGQRRFTNGPFSS